MKRFVLAFLFLAGALSLRAGTVSDRCVKDSLRYKGETHVFWTYTPSELSPEAPLLICLHGYGGRADRYGTQLVDLAEEKGFVVCFPQGLKDGRGRNCWNVGYPFQEGLKRDDVGFLEHLAKYLVKTYSLHPSNAFLTGMSNGGEMCYLMARRKPKLFAGILSIAGLTLPEMTPLRYAHPVPFMEVHGTADRTSKWEGDPEGKDGWGAYLSVPAAVSYVVAADGCRSYCKEALPLIRKAVTLHKYLGGTSSPVSGKPCEVWFYEVDGGGHNWSDKDMDTYHEMWKFMDHFMTR
ncbi:MAG: prolyl oligopeptidase family serine peptidase [Bacteroidales bacterium]|nr:prolyl oligopeptidase family serine peptidase [Bacteroidales bacterium]